MKTAQILVLASALIGAAGCAATRERMGTAKPVAYRDLPAAVQTTVRQEVGNAQVKRITEETKNGAPAYRVEVEEPWHNSTLWVNNDGAIIKESKKLAERKNVNEAAGAQAPEKPAPAPEATPAPAPEKEAPSGY